MRIAAELGRSFLERATADQRFDVDVRPVRDEESLAATVGHAHVLVTRAYNRVTRRVIDAAPRLELIAQGTSGIDNIDLEATRERGIAVIHLPGVNANAVAELVMGLVVVMTRTVPAYTREMLAGRWTRADCGSRHEMRHHRLGIVGLGKVGRRVARLAGAFGMTVQAHDPYLTDDDFRDRGALPVDSLRTLVTASDVVTLHVPLTAETRGLFGPGEIAAMKPGSFLLNTARGEVLDRRAALDALVAGHLGGLALDVFDPEPPSDPFPDHPGLILTPHVAGCSFEAKAEIGATLYDRISAFYSAGGRQ